MMKSDKFSALAAFLKRRGLVRERNANSGKLVGALVHRMAVEGEDERLARLSEETGTSVRALSLFSKIDESTEFTANSAHKDFGRVRFKEVA